MCSSVWSSEAKWETGERPVRTRRCDHVVCTEAAMQPGATGAEVPGRQVTDVKWEPEDLHMTMKLFQARLLMAAEYHLQYWKRGVLSSTPFYYVGNIVFDIFGISTKVSYDNTWRSHFCSSDYFETDYRTILLLSLRIITKYWQLRKEVYYR